MTNGLGWIVMVAVLSIASEGTAACVGGARVPPPTTDWCVLVPGTQTAADDTDGDGYADECDADYNQDCYVTVLDDLFGPQGFALRFGSTVPPASAIYDHNGDNIVGIADFSIWTGVFNTTGPLPQMDHQ